MTAIVLDIPHAEVPARRADWVCNKCKETFMCPVTIWNNTLYDSADVEILRTETMCTNCAVESTKRYRAFLK